MKTLLRLAIVAPLTLLGAVAALAEAAPKLAAQSQPVEAAAPVSDRGVVVQKAKAELSEWRIKLDAFTEKAKAESLATRTKAAAELNTAWENAKTAAARLETASAAEWDSAKAEFQKKSAALSAAWAKKTGPDAK